MTLQFQRNQLRVRDESGNVLLIVRKADDEVEVYLNGHIQGGLERVS